MKWLPIIFNIVHLIGPELRKALLGALDDWESKAKETKSPIDDIVVGVLKALLG